MALAGHHERVDDGGALAGVGVADEEPVLLADGRGADGVFDEVVVESGLGVLEVGGERLPVCEQIPARLAKPGLRQALRWQRQREPAQPVERPGKVFLPQRRPRGADVRLVPFALELVEPADEAQDALGGLRSLGGRFKKPPVRVRPAAEPHHALVRLREARICLAFDAWGKRVDPGTGAAITGATSGGFTRGFTDHEQLDDLGLVHMNGRVFDPVLGRFLSVDPYVGDPCDSQDYNRYSYLGNNPLGGTDPSGYFSLKDAAKIVAVVVAAVVTAGAALYAIGGASSFLGGMGMVATASFGSGWAGLANAMIAGAAGGFGSGFAGSLLNGGSIGDAFRAGVIGAAAGGVSAGLAFGIGELGFSGVSKHLAHGVTQGGVTEATGGEFRHGFYAAAFASAAAGPISRAVPGGVPGQVVAAAVVGGTASAVGGGKFANGAFSGAFTYLFNAAAHAAAPASAKSVKTIEEAKAFLKQQGAAGVHHAQEAYDALTRSNVSISFVNNLAEGVMGDTTSNFTTTDDLKSVFKSATIKIRQGLTGENLLATLVHEAHHSTQRMKFGEAQYFRELDAYVYEEEYRIASKFSAGGPGFRRFGRLNRTGISEYVEKLHPSGFAIP